MQNIISIQFEDKIHIGYEKNPQFNLKNNKFQSCINLNQPVSTKVGAYRDWTEINWLVSDRNQYVLD